MCITLPEKYNVNDWPGASGQSVAKAIIRSQPADFFVEEKLGFTLSGDGEHVFLLVEKTGQNTIAIAERLAGFAKVLPRSIGYAGLKDRNAVTRQWFSIQLPKVEAADWERLNSEDLTILDVARHHKKLRKGVLQQNIFKLLLRDVEGDRGKIDNRLIWIREHGVPNYFGSQRFGRYGDNVHQAAAWLTGNLKSPSRHLKGIYLSSIRSFLFNEILASRVRNRVWNKGIAGDIFMLQGSHSCFLAPDQTDDLQLRLQQQDIHPAAILYGQNGLECAADARQIQQKTLKQYPILVTGLEELKMKSAWRSMRLLVADLKWQWLEGKQLLLGFSLPPGSYATSVLAELC